MPSMPASGPCKEIISQAAFDLFMKRCASEAMPCSRLAIAASDFADNPEESKSITKYFSKQKNRNDKHVSVKSCQPAQDADIQIPQVKCSEVTIERQNEARKARDVSEDINLPEGISGIDIEEQKRIFKEVSMLHNLKTDKRANKSNQVQDKTRRTERKRDIAGILKYFEKK
jgi:hypothetical protein